MSQATRAQIDANRANAEHSTGPSSDAGKAASSQNRRTHGLAGAFTVLSNEDPIKFFMLQEELRDEWHAQTPTEHSYVDSLAQHLWLIQRCHDLLNRCYNPESAAIDHEKHFALVARYQTANERGRDRCVNQLLKLRAEKRKEQIGFESQKRHEASETRKVETHQARLHLIQTAAEFPRIPFKRLNELFRATLQEINGKLKTQEAAA